MYVYEVTEGYRTGEVFPGGTFQKGMFRAGVLGFRQMHQTAIPV